MLIRPLAVATIASLCWAPFVHAQELTGARVTGATYCCDAPDEASRSSNFVTATVGPDVEFPLGSFISIVQGLKHVAPAVDIGAHTLELRYPERVQAYGDTFDGLLFTFAGAPTITTVTLDPSSTLTPRDLSYTGNSITINHAGLQLTPESRVLLNISLIPEPITPGMFLAGLGLLAVVARRRTWR